MREGVSEALEDGRVKEDDRLSLLERDDSRLSTPFSLPPPLSNLST